MTAKHGPYVPDKSQTLGAFDIVGHDRRSAFFHCLSLHSIGN